MKRNKPYNDIFSLRKGCTLKDNYYSILSLLGIGDFTFAYKAKGVDGSTVVIKELFIQGRCVRDEMGYVQLENGLHQPLLEKYCKRVSDDMLRLTKVHHLNLVPLKESFSQNNTIYYVVPFVEGKSLTQIVEEFGTVNISKCLSYAKLLAETLQSMHSQFLFHQAVCPDNVIVDSSEKVWFVDYGSSKEFLFDVINGKTNSLPDWFAPLELYTRTPPPGAFTDVYSLAALCYYCLTAIIPTPTNVRGINELPLLNSIDSSISTKFSETINKALSVIPSMRHQSFRNIFRRFRAV